MKYYQPIFGQGAGQRRRRAWVAQGIVKEPLQSVPPHSVPSTIRPHTKRPPTKSPLDKASRQQIVPATKSPLLQSVPCYKASPAIFFSKYLIFFNDSC